MTTPDSTPAALFAANQRLALFFANRFWASRARQARLRYRGYDLDDVVQVALIGLDIAARNFIGDGRAAFSTFAGACIRRRLRHLIDRTPSVVCREIPTADEEWLAVLCHRIPDPAEVALDAIAAAELREVIEGAMQELPARLAEAIRLRAEGLTYAEVGQRLGISGERARTLCEDARRRLAELLADIER